MPIFDETVYPIPTAQLIEQADWPRKKTIIGRGLLGLQMKAGAVDLADGKVASVSSITSHEHPREYHHLFPESLLKRAEVPSEQIFRALNCALMIWKTNRAVSDKDPIQYLKERADNCALGEREWRRRLMTHLIPFEALAKGPFDENDKDFKSRVKSDYEAFLSSRAALLEKAARLACDGRSPEIATIAAVTD